MPPQFHIVFEIYTPKSPSLCSLPALVKKKVLAFDNLHFPTTDTDIFDPNLPDDTFRSLSWSNKREFPARPDDRKDRRKGRADRRADRRAWSYDFDSEKRQAVKGNFPSQGARPQNATAAAASSSQEVSGTGAGPTATDQHTPRHLDYRFSFVSAESIDMDSVEARTTNQSGRARAKSLMFADAARPSSAAVTKAEFMPLKSKVTGFGYGIVHLYREVEGAPSLSAGSAGTSSRKILEPVNAVPVKDGGSADSIPGAEPGDMTTVAILAVPSYMTPSDFLGFVGEDARENVSHFRMIRTGDNARRYMVLMKFREEEKAQDFVRSFNGRVFNSMEPETCHVVYVRSIKFQPPNYADAENLGSHSDGKGRLHPTSAYPDISNDPFSPSHSPQPPDDSSNQNDGDPPPPYQSHSSPTISKSFSIKPAPPPTPSLLELPTCPVCLERMDETTGLLTIQCQHVFHCACLSKWKDSSCPVCRYSSITGIGTGKRRTGGRAPVGGDDDDDDLNMCNICGALSNLWICLICGNVGCGRYDEKHAYEHFLETSHCFAMDVDSQRVWDYASDAYVHRLIQNKSDGKLVELPANSSTLTGTTDGEYVPVEKLENICLEYTHLLTSQLDSQRMYFEEQLLAAADKASTAISKADQAFQDADNASTELGSIKSQYEELQLDVLPNLEKSKERAEKKAEKAVEMLRKIDKDYRDEKAVSNGLMERVDVLSKENSELRQQNEDLKEQIRDLMFFLEGRDKLKEMNEEGIEEGVVTVGEAESKKKRRGKGKGKGQK